MGFLSNHVPGTIELGKLKNPYQDYQFNFFKLNYIFSAFLADQDLIVYYAFTFQSIEVWFFDTCYFMSHGHVFALPWRYWAITWKCFIYNVFFYNKIWSSYDFRNNRHILSLKSFFKPQIFWVSDLCSEFNWACPTKRYQNRISFIFFKIFFISIWFFA